ncbi:hypothetical protein GCM10022392_14390 [Mucilaginibacter panaciglaebae]|uniref:Acyltransferase-like protein n=1 Tax=Mucilaginibacter panaciglaebae TaxID=502331 RepID=A0ABP7WPT8_9SPHI
MAENVTSNNIIALKRVIIWGIPCAIFVLGVVLSEYEFKYKTPGFLIEIGDASYSCYLVHYFIVQRINTHFRVYISYAPDLSLIMIILIILFLSLFVYKYIEKRITDILRLKLQNSYNLSSVIANE